MLWHRLKSLVQSLFQAGRLNQEMDEEIQFHLDHLTQDLIRSGMSPREASREARLRFGSPERVKSRSREEKGLAFFDEFTQNVRFSIRSMLRHPLLSFTFILTLGLCVGSSTATFSVVDSVLWKPLPYPDSDRLAVAVRYNPNTGISPEYSSVDGTDWERIRDGSGFSQSAVFSGWPSGVNLLADAGSAFVQQQRIGAGYFRTLGVNPARGREFERSEDIPGGPAVAILSHGLWARTFGSDPDILGTTIRLKGEPHTVVGIMPEGFQPHIDADVWTPLRPNRSGEGSGTNYTVAVRLPPGMAWREADARLGAIDAARAGQEDAPPQRYGLVPLNQVLTAGVRTPVLLVFGAVLVMLLVGCANLAGLQLARFLSRRPEIATRQALGGGAGVLSRQMLTENLVLGVLGGGVGLAMAYLATETLAEVVGTRLGTWQTVQMDSRALAASLGFTGLAVFLFGMAPVFQARRLNLRGILGGGARGVVGGKGHRLRKGLLIGQVALVTALLFSAGLLVRSYGHLAGLDPGFDPEGVLTVQLSLDDARFQEGTEVVGFFQETLEAIAGLPGIRSAAVALTLPYERPLNLPFHLPGIDGPGEIRVANAVYVTPDFLETLDIPLLNGRDLEPADGPEAPRVVLVNRAFVDAYLDGSVSLGTPIDLRDGHQWAVVGVVGNVQQTPGFGDGGPIQTSPTIYMPAAQADGSFFQAIHIWFAPSWLIRGTGDPSEWGPDVTRAIESVNPDMPVARIAPLDRIVDTALAQPRLGATFLVMVAGFALILALVGLYGIIANEVTERRAEMGLRMALGSTPGGAVWTVGMTGVHLVTWGIGVGAVLSFGVARVLTHVVWGVAPTDPLAIGAALLSLVTLGSAASFLPAFRLGRMNPSQILQDT